MIRTITALLTIVFCLIGFAPVRAQDAAASHPLDSHLTESYAEDLDGLLKRKYIRVLTTYNRTNFFLDRGKLRGFEYALLRQYQKALNKGVTRRELQIVFEFIPVARDRLIPDLVEGYGDIAAAGLTITPERQKQVDFTIPYVTGIDEVLVTHKAVAPIQDITALSAHSVFVRPSSSYHESLLALNRRLSAQGLWPVKIVLADENLETEDILELVNSGAIARTVCDSHIAAAWAEILTDIRVVGDVTFRKGGDIAWAVRKTSPALKASLDRFAKNPPQRDPPGQHLFYALLRKYDLDQKSAGGRLGKEAGGLCPAVQGICRPLRIRLAIDQRHGLPGIRFRPQAKSARRERSVSCRFARKPLPIRRSGFLTSVSVENNIQAGVKYLNFLRDQYFNDAAILPRDQVRFSLAAYNAGPVKMRRARKKAITCTWTPTGGFAMWKSPC